MSEIIPTERPARDSLWLFLLELAIVAALFVADIYHHIYFSKTPYLFLLGWTSLRLRGLRWRDVGFARPRSWGKAILIGIVVGIGMEVLELFVTQPFLARLFHKMPDLSDFNDMVGNLKLFLIYMVLLWTLGALGEEIVYRGYMMNRVAAIFHGTKSAWVFSLVAVSIVFGCAHLDQGATGMVENIWAGFLLGLLYLACGRNLAIPVIAHAVGDTLDFVLIYLGKYPGMK